MQAIALSDITSTFPFRPGFTEMDLSGGIWRVTYWARGIAYQWHLTNVKGARNALYLPENQYRSAVVSFKIIS